MPAKIGGNESPEITVDGALDMAGPMFLIGPRAPQLNDYALRLEFDRNTVTFRNGRARMLGGPVRFGSVVSRAGTRSLHLGGVAAARDVGLFLDLPALTRLTGRAEWRGNLSFGTAGSHLQLESSLVGIGSRMPAPLDKLEPVALPLRLDPIIHLMITPMAGAPPAFAWPATFIFGNGRLRIRLTGKASPLHLSHILN